MKTNILTTLIFLLTIACSTFGQKDGYYKNHDFVYELPVRLQKDQYEDNIENKDSSYVMLDRSIFCYEMYPGGAYTRRWISHKVYYIGNESDIEEINKLYLYAGSSANSIDVDVRTTTSDGREIMLDESKMEDVSKDDGAVNYKILAISGIEKHSWVEVLVSRKNQSTHRRFSVSNPFPTKKAEVFVHCSEKLTKYHSDMKVRFNNYGKFQIEEWLSADAYSSDEKKARFSKLRDSLLVKPIATATDVMPYADESYSHEYDGYTYLDVVGADYNWEEAGKGIGTQIFYQLKYEMNGRKFLKGLDIQELSDLEQLKAIEKFIKEDIVETESGDDNYSNTAYIWKKKIANESGLIKMADQMLNAAGLKYKVYLCSDKDYLQIDPDFAFSSGMQDILFYFPELDVYMMPTNGYYYAGEIPNYLASTVALVVKDNEFPQTGVGKVKRLPDAAREKNLDGTRAVIDIDPIEETCTVKKTKFLYGDRATRSRGYYHFSDQDERKEYVEQWLVDDLEMELSDIEIKNESLELNFGSADTVYYSGVLEGSEIMTSIPNGFILNPGGIMGTQVSFYDTEDRVANIYLPESKTYKHTIIVNIPEGYTVEGLANLEFDERYSTKRRWLYGETREKAKYRDEESRAEFISTATFTGDQIRIEIDEFYVEGFYPKEGMTELQKVVNAAYEFFIAKIKFVEE